MSIFSRVAITGASTYSGRYITKHLLAKYPTITEIRNLTNHPNRKFEDMDSHLKNSTVTYSVHPLKFDEYAALLQSLRGVDVLICTFWMRYTEKGENPALGKVKTLVDAAVEAGVKRMIYVSHTQPSIDSDIPYIKAKSLAEKYVQDKMASYAFVRPCCLFGDTPNESIVVNNTAYVMRKAPIMLFHHGAKNMHFQPVHVQDFAELACRLAFDKDVCNQNVAVDAVGPEKLTILEYMDILSRAMGIRWRNWFLAAAPTWMIYSVTPIINCVLNDIFVDNGDMMILHQDLACTLPDKGKLNPATGCYDFLKNSPGADRQTLNHDRASPHHLISSLDIWQPQRKFSVWCEENKAILGKTYVNTFERYYDMKGLNEFSKKVD